MKFIIDVIIQALELTQALTEMDSRNTLRVGGKSGRCLGLTTLKTSYVVMISGSLKLLESSGPVQSCKGIALIFYVFDDFISIRFLSVGQIRYRYCQY